MQPTKQLGLQQWPEQSEIPDLSRFSFIRTKHAICSLALRSWLVHEGGLASLVAERAAAKNTKRVSKLNLSLAISFSCLSLCH